MSFRFWNKTENKEELPRPKSIPDTVGRDLVVKMHKDPDWVWSLKGVVKLHQADSKTKFDFRVFDERDAALKGVRVKNYKTLDEHPELILFDGWFDKKTLQVHVEEKSRAEFKKVS
jgi:hypothetical protein